MTGARRVAAGAVLPLLLAGAACRSEGGTSEATRSCDGVRQPADPNAALPASLPVGVPEATFYEVQTLGVTKLHYAHAPGTDLVATRDAVKSAYERAGVVIEGSDAEAGAEAEFQFSTAREEGSVQVVPLCKGTLRIRYRVGPK